MVSVIIKNEFSIICSRGEKVSEPGSQKFFWVASFAENFPENISTFWDNSVYSTYKLQLLYFIYTVHTIKHLHPFKYLTEINYFTHPCDQNEVKW
jgi:hypothetical protein